MRRIPLGFFMVGCVVALFGAIAGCKDGKPQNDGGSLPDGFVSNTCTTVMDCSPTACQTAKCNPITKVCEYKDKSCSADSECTKGVCDPTTADGACTQQPANDNADCTTMDGAAGKCLSGTCSPVPSCAPGGVFSVSDAECDSAGLSVKQDTNAPMSFGGGMPVVNAYPCAATENGPEIAFALNHDSTAGDEDITVSIRPVEANGAPALADDKDLDLIVLEDQCTGTATCMNPSDGNGGYKGVTAGTARERVTFKAVAGHDYYFVVDGKDMNQVKDFIIEVEACGRCQPTEGTRLDCNMTMPIMTSTAAGAAQLTDYKCGTMMTAVAAAGKEIPFYFRTNDDAVRNVTASLTGATADYKILALPTTLWGQCDPNKCVDTVSGTTAQNKSLTFKVDPNGGDFARYWVVVDTPGTTDASFGLQLTCAPYCLSTADSLSCTSAGEVKKVTGTTIGAPKLVDHWGPGAGCDGLTGLTGPERAVQFKFDAVGGANYELRLSSKTAGVNLSMTLLDGGATMGPACDPTLTCRANLVQPGPTFSGTRVAGAKPAAIRFSAQQDPGGAYHSYFVVVDSVGGTGGDFDLQAIGLDPGSNCP